MRQPLPVACGLYSGGEQCGLTSPWHHASVDQAAGAANAWGVSARQWHSMRSDRPRTSLSAPLRPRAASPASSAGRAAPRIPSSGARSPMRCAALGSIGSKASPSISSRSARRCGSIQRAMSARSGCCSRRSTLIAGSAAPGLADSRRLLLHRYRREYRRLLALRRSPRRPRRAHPGGRAAARHLRAADLQHRPESVRHGQGCRLCARRQAGRADAVPRPCEQGRIERAHPAFQ